MGTIVFEQPDKIFNYVPDGLTRLKGTEVQEAIELITEYRDKTGIMVTLIWFRKFIYRNLKNIIKKCLILIS